MAVSKMVELVSLDQFVEGNSIGFSVGSPAKVVECLVVKTGRWHYSGQNYAVLEFKPCAGVKGFLRVNLESIEQVQKAVADSFLNRFSLGEFCKNPSKFAGGVETWTDWGNGWQWEEGQHSSQPRGFRCEVSMGWQRWMRIQKKWDNYRMPGDVAYFAAKLEWLPFVNL